MRTLLVSRARARPLLTSAILRRYVIVALELLILFVFDSHAEEKDVRKNNRRVDEKKFYG
jgi:hypothetical protein